MLTRRLTATLLLLCLISGCAVNPVTGKRELTLVTQDQELAIGAEQYGPAQQSQGGVFRIDPELSRYVNAVGQRLAAVSDRQLPYEFVVLNNSVPNAWALPGGKIAVNRGLLLELHNEAELAAVLGHEIVHAAARHGANAMQRGLLLQGVVIATALSAADSNYANYIVGGAQIGAQLVTTRYSRDAELEADYYGMQYMARAGFDPSAAIGLQETFVQLSAGRESSWIEGLFASHPPSPDRVAANKMTAQALNATGEINQAQYETQIKSLKNRLPAYQLLDKATALAAKNHLEQAVEAIDQAIESVPEEARFDGLKGEILLSQARYPAAVAAFSTALTKDSSYFEYHLGRGLARAKLGDAQAARVDLEQSIKLLPTALASNELGQMSLANGDLGNAKRYFQAAMGAGGGLGTTASMAFMRLDLEDNPEQYISVAPAMTEAGHLVATVLNRTNLKLTSISVEFSARVNGQPAQIIRTVAQLAPNAQYQLDSGWQFKGADQLEAIQIRVLKARAAP
ncbi:MAG: M48 family metalloprotease [SAR86 cluster bacterium]